VEPTAGDLLSTTYKPAAACGERSQAIGESWGKPRGRLDWRGGYAASNRTQEDLKPALEKAQPREAPLEVEVVQLQQGQPAPLAV
jgi:hypothetical protein